MKMRSGAWLAAAVVGAVCACAPRTVDASACSSLSGPFCVGGSSDFKAPPAHMATSLDVDEQRVREANLNKQLKIESVLKQYEMEPSRHESLTEQDRLLEELSELLDETAALLAELREDEVESPVIGSFAFSSEGDTYELLETMDGKELKEFFELAFDEVLRQWESTLEDMSPEISQGLRGSVEELKNLKDYESYEFRHLDENSLSIIRQRFDNHRLMEVQRAFERLVIAKNPHERQAAFESAVYVFQLAEEEAEEAEEDAAAAEANTEDAPRSDAVDEASDSSKSER